MKKFLAVLVVAAAVIATMFFVGMTKTEGEVYTDYLRIHVRANSNEGCGYGRYGRTYSADRRGVR